MFLSTDICRHIGHHVFFFKLHKLLMLNHSLDLLELLLSSLIVMSQHADGLFINLLLRERLAEELLPHLPAGNLLTLSNRSAAVVLTLHLSKAFNQLRRVSRKPKAL